MIKIPLQDLKIIDNHLTELKKLSHQLHRLDESDCNYGLTEKQEKRKNKLLNRVKELASEIRFKIYHQSDPRGCSLYLLDETISRDDYTQ